MVQRRKPQHSVLFVWGDDSTVIGGICLSDITKIEQCYLVPNGTGDLELSRFPFTRVTTSREVNGQTLERVLDIPLFTAETFTKLKNSLQEQAYGDYAVMLSLGVLPEDENIRNRALTMDILPYPDWAQRGFPNVAELVTMYPGLKKPLRGEELTTTTSDYRMAYKSAAVGDTPTRNNSTHPARTAPTGSTCG